MCECCAQHAAHQQGHIHIRRIDSDNCFKDLERVLANVPGVVGVEFNKEAGQARVVFDKRILETTSLEDILEQEGFAVS